MSLLITIKQQPENPQAWILLHRNKNIFFLFYFKSQLWHLCLEVSPKREEINFSAPMKDNVYESLVQGLSLLLPGALF